MSRVATNGIFLNVEVTGDGPIVLMLHGFTRDARAWEPVLPALDGYRVVRVDLIGHGKSDAPEDPSRYTMAHAVEDLTALLHHLSVDKYALVGYSLGGRVGLHLATAAPERLWALVIESASPGIEDAAQRAARVESDEKLAQSIFTDGIEAFADRWQAQGLFASQASLPEGVLAEQRRQRIENSPARPRKLAAGHGRRRAGLHPRPPRGHRSAVVVPRRALWTPDTPRWRPCWPRRSPAPSTPSSRTPVTRPTWSSPKRGRGWWAAFLDKHSPGAEA